MMNSTFPKPVYHKPHLRCPLKPPKSHSSLEKPSGTAGVAVWSPFSQEAHAQESLGAGLVHLTCFLSGPILILKTSRDNSCIWPQKWSEESLDWSGLVFAVPSAYECSSSEV